MSEFSKQLEQIRQGDLRITAITREITQMGADVKKIEKELSAMDATLKQIQEDNRYKGDKLVEKDYEANMFRLRFNIGKDLLEQKKEKKKTEEINLEYIKQATWNSRIHFCDEVAEFMERNNFLTYRSQKFQTAIRQKEEEELLDKEIFTLQQELVNLKTQLNQLNKKENVIQQMENERQLLIKEPEIGYQFLRLQSCMQESYKELKELNQLITQRVNKVNNSSGIQHSSYVFSNSYYQQFVTSERKQFAEKYEGTIDNLQSQGVRNPKHVFVPKTPSGLSRNT